MIRIYEWPPPHYTETTNKEPLTYYPDGYSHAYDTDLIPYGKKHDKSDRSLTAAQLFRQRQQGK